MYKNSCGQTSYWNLTVPIPCHSLQCVLHCSKKLPDSSGHCHSVSQYHIIINCKQSVWLMSMCNPQGYVVKVGISMQNYKRYTISMQILQTELYVYFMRVWLSHCQDSCTPCRCVNCSASSPFPESFTACTTVFQVRERSPVPLSWASHFSTSCNIHAPTSDWLPLSMLFMMGGFTHRCVPNSLHWASKSWFRALITSECQMKNGEGSMMHSTQRVASMTMTYVSDNAPNPYSGRLNIDNSTQRKRRTTEFCNQVLATALHQL